MKFADFDIFSSLSLNSTINWEFCIFNVDNLSFTIFIKLSYFSFISLILSSVYACKVPLILFIWNFNCSYMLSTRFLYSFISIEFFFISNILLAISSLLFNKYSFKFENGQDIPISPEINKFSDIILSYLKQASDKSFLHAVKFILLIIIWLIIFVSIFFMCESSSFFSSTKLNFDTKLFELIWDRITLEVWSMKLSYFFCSLEKFVATSFLNSPKYFKNSSLNKIKSLNET